MLRVFLLSFFSIFTVFVSGQATRIFDQRDYGFGELSSNLITSVTQDQNGYIWIATEYGLNKFDGVRFVQYLHDVQDSTSISSNHVTLLHRDGKNRLWIGCSNGLQYYDDHRDEFVQIKFPEKIAPHIIDILTRSNGTLLVATSGWGLFSIDINDNIAHSLVPVNKLAGGMYGRKLLEDREKRVWIATDRAGVICLSPDLLHAKKFSTDEVPYPKGGKYNITNTPSGDILLAYNSEVVIADKSLTKFTPLSFEKGNRPMINEIRVAQDGNIYLSTEGSGIWHLNLSESSWLIRQTELSNLDKNYSKATIRTFFQDQESNFWLGWFQRGLVFIPASSHQFEFWRILEIEESDSKKINTILTDRKKHIWYSVESAGLYKVDSTGRILTNYPNLTDITQLLEDKKGNIWFLSSRRGLGKIDQGKKEAIYLNVFQEKGARAMALGKNGKLYISTFGNGFAEYTPEENSFRQFTMNDTTNPNGVLGNDWVNTILCGKNGLIWLGHHKGVSCYDPETHAFINQGANEGLSEQIVLSLLEDKSQNIWVGTYNGLHMMDQNQKLTSYTTNDGLSSNVISGLGEDNQGNIWCSTFNGINYVNPKENRIVTYYTGDGLVDRTYNRSVYFQDDAGKIYFGGKQGITSFYPEEVQLTKYTHPVYVTNLYIRNQTIKPGELSGRKPIYRESLAKTNEFYFGNQDDSFTLELSTMDFKSPENVHYEYRLKGFNKTWNTTLPGVNLITYNNLSPGDHELEIRACKFGAYSESKFLTLHVMPPWYRSTLAYFVYVLLLLGVLTFIFHYLRERRLEKLHAYKLQLFTDISHEIRSPLTLVLSPIDKLIKNTGDDQTKETLQNMRRNAHRILTLVNQLLDIRKLEGGQLQLKFQETNVGEFVTQCAEAFKEQALERNITFQITSDANDTPIWVDPNSLDKVIHNLLSNAYKFTPDGGSIDVQIKTSSNKQDNKQPHYVEISISDSGSGVPLGETKKIFKRFYQGNNQITGGQQGSGIGLHLTRVLVEKHGGKVFVENRTDISGSRFIVQIPSGTRHLAISQIITTNSPVLFDKPKTSKTKISPSPVIRKTNYKVLIVDDEKEILRYVNQELQSVYKIISAENGSEAFQLAIAQLPDLVISDVSMPELDGFEFVKKLKSNSATNHIPIILLTAKINHDDRMQGFGLGADAYLTKPFLIDELMMVAENLIKNRMTVKGKYSGAQDQEGKIKTISFKSSEEILMERIVSIVNQYLEDPSLNVQLLANEVGLSRVQLHRKVKALTGISTSEFIRNIRLKQAEKLLLDKQMNISQVAYALGFTNQTHFSTLFKKVYGLSPSEYISRHAKSIT